MMVKGSRVAFSVISYTDFIFFLLQLLYCSTVPVPDTSLKVDQYKVVAYDGG